MIPVLICNPQSHQLYSSSCLPLQTHDTDPVRKFPISWYHHWSLFPIWSNAGINLGNASTINKIARTSRNNFPNFKKKWDQFVTKWKISPLQQRASNKTTKIFATLKSSFYLNSLNKTMPLQPLSNPLKNELRTWVSTIEPEKQNDPAKLKIGTNIANKISDIQSDNIKNMNTI